MEQKEKGQTPMETGKISQDLCRFKPESEQSLASKPPFVEILKNWFILNKKIYKVTDKGSKSMNKSLRNYLSGSIENLDDKSIGGELYLNHLSDKEARKVIKDFYDGEIDAGKGEELIKEGLIIYPSTRFPWKKYTNQEERTEIIKLFVNNFNKSKKDIIAEDFKENGLGGLFFNYYAASCYKAFKEAGFAYSEEEVIQHAKDNSFKTEKLYPWELNSTSMNFWDNRENRISAVKWLLWKTKKFLIEINLKDFRNNNLTGFIYYYNNSPYGAFKEAGFAYSEEEVIQHAKDNSFKTEKLYPWELNSTSMNFWDNRENRISAVKWLLWNTKKSPKELSTNDFNPFLSGLLNSHYYAGSCYKAFKEAGFAYSEEEVIQHAKDNSFKTEKLYPWELSATPINFYQNSNNELVKENRISAVKWLLWKTKKSPNEIKSDDLIENGLSGIFGFYNGSPYKIFLEFGVIYLNEEIQQHAKDNSFKTEKFYPWELSVPRNFWDNRENRISAVKWLLWKTKKHPNEVNTTDFRTNCLDGLISNYYKYSSYKALLEAELIEPRK